MHKIEVNIVQAQHLQTLVEAFFCPRMEGAPQLGSHKDIFTLDARGETFGKALADFCLVAIYICRVNVLVANSQCMGDCISNLADITLPCSETAAV